MTTLREYRLRKGWTQEEFARRLSVEQSLYSKWERGASVPRVGNAARIARVTRGEVKMGPLAEGS